MQEPETKQIVHSDGEFIGSRALIGATIGLLLVYGAGLAALGTPPAAAESGAQVVAWLREHREGVRWYAWTWTVSTPLFAVVITLLRRLLPAPHRDVFFIGAVTILVVGAPQAWFWGGLALHADTLDAATARAVLDVAVFWGPVLTGATTTMIAPVTLLALRRQAELPRWLGILGAVAFVEQAIETVTIFGATGFTQPGGAMNLQLGAGLTLAWLLAFALWGGIRGRVASPAL